MKDPPPPGWAAVWRPSRGWLAGSPLPTVQGSVLIQRGLFQTKASFFLQQLSRRARSGAHLLADPSCRDDTLHHTERSPLGWRNTARGLKTFWLLHNPIIPAKPPPNHKWTGVNWCIWVFVEPRRLPSPFNVSNLPQELQADRGPQNGKPWPPEPETSNLGF